ncbi:hypothetical protein [Streptomyces sp. NBC_01244]|uniref:hypothetical protein n=1 Tax=Streptomyces sp. NBC_01244 TaxID=2903797 RepID=UPI002E10490E|nr:hypothetical protein OG247_06505 [Streptomyces sp. NBC_01244]
MTSPGQAADFRPTHIVPQDGLPAWETPDLSRPTVPLDAFLPVRLLSRRGEWGEILCANGWSAWVDGRLLLAVPQPPPTGGRPLTRVEDPQPLLARCTEELERYRRAVTDLAAGRTDPESFRRSLRGVRVGVVVDGESVWLYDETAGRWMYGDGSRLATYAVVAGPGAPPAPQTPPAEADTEGGGDVRDVPHVPHEPTKIVELPGPETG